MNMNHPLTKEPEGITNSRAMLSCVGVCALIAALFVVSLWLDTLVYKWVVNDVLIGFVEAGLLLSTITVWQAFKISALVSLIIALPIGISVASSR